MIVAEVERSIVEELNHVFDENDCNTRRFAVRSSAVGEDSEDLSAAGQNETILGEH